MFLSHSSNIKSPEQSSSVRMSLLLKGTAALSNNLS
jgi:hypothetical protein